ncbi:protein ORF119 [Lake sturgeon herpesvirus]|nr:protein ORF119 [Lake sturgeon herpesvirus]
MEPLTHKELICERGLTLDTLQDRFNSDVLIDNEALNGFVRLYFNKDFQPNHLVVDDLKLEPDFLFIHKFIFVSYLERYAVKQTMQNDREVITYIYLNVQYESAVLFLTGIYLRFFGLLTDQGQLTQHRLNLNPLNDHSGELLELARFYDLNWLKLFFIQTVTDKVNFEGYVFLSNNQLTVVNNQKELFSIGAPAHTRAFTMTSDGCTWYALCNPIPDTVELWIKLYHQNSWTLMTSVSDLHDAAIVRPLEIERPSFQLTLAESVCLFVLQNKQHLTCYNLATQTWHKIKMAPHAPNMTFCMTKTGDGSLPLTLVANARYKHVIVCKLAKDVWCWDKRETDRQTPIQTSLVIEDTNYKITQIKPESVANFWTGLVKHQLKPDVNEKIRQKIAQELNLSNPLVECEGEGDNYYAGPSRKRPRTFNSNEPCLDRPVLFDNPLVKYKFNQPCDSDKSWWSVTVVKGHLYGKQMDGSWWTVELHPETHKMGKWTKLERPSQQHLSGTWHPQNKNIDWIDYTFNSITVSGKTTPVHFFNPNYTDENMTNVTDSQGKMVYQTSRCDMIDNTMNSVKGGLDSLIGMQTVTDNNGEFLSFNLPKRQIPIALTVLLANISKGAVEAYDETGSMVYENGGVCPIDELHPLTQTRQLEVYTLKPATSHLVLKDNFRHLLNRYAYDPCPLLQGVGSFLLTNECSSHTLFNNFNRNCFVFETNNLCAVFKPE